ncbi:MAG: aminotransferase class III-fold pyridoxal phosphate-dependent enzyme [Phycisphaerales bacterium]|nr:aminotransferase class III-fold pyridoxal phosphate-dependent enzyme [Phycisphaerales bacterium]
MTDPSAEITAATQLLEEGWGVRGRLVRLPGENMNIRVETEPGPRVFKITIDPMARVDLEEVVLDKLREAGLPVPTSIADRDGGVIREVTYMGGSASARLQEFLPGDAWRDAASDARLLGSIGESMARLHEALAEVSEEQPGIGRTHQWDLAEAGQHRAQIGRIEDVQLRKAVERCFHLHAAIARPRLALCPQGVIHGDGNDENLLVSDGKVVGILDVGDAQWGALIQDLAITLAYALQHEGVDLESASELVAGYESVRALATEEREALFPLAMARLATSAVIGAVRRAEHADHATWFSHEQTTAAAIARMADVTPGDAAAALFGESSRPGGDEAELTSARESLLGPSLSLSYQRPLHIVRGRGQYLHAADGLPYLDLVNNVCHVGHCHPKVVAAISEQAATLNTNTRYLHEHIVDYGRRLTATMPEGLDTCFLVNSGSEANELALRLARAATGAHDVVVIDGAYHGNTGNCVAMSPYKFDGPGGSGCPEWVHVTPIPDAYRGEIRGDGDDVGSAYALELARVIGEACADGRSIAGFFAEPILSCGGQVPLPSGYLAAAFEHVRKAGGVCIADEVQVGFGRVGEAFWGFELHDVVPDIVVMGKPIGNGHPMGAVVTTRAIAEAFNNGMEFFSTFGGNPVSSACGRAVLDVIEEEGLQGRAQHLGEVFLDGLRGLMDRHELIGDVRGEGLFLGIEFVRDRTTLEPADTEASAIVNAMRDRGVLLSTDGPLHNVIKIKPPLVLDEQDIEMTIRLLDEVLAEVGTT